MQSKMCWTSNCFLMLWREHLRLGCVLPQLHPPERVSDVEQRSGCFTTPRTPLWRAALGPISFYSSVFFLKKKGQYRTNGIYVIEIEKQAFLALRAIRFQPRLFENSLFVKKETSSNRWYLLSTSSVWRVQNHFIRRKLFNWFQYAYRFATMRVLVNMNSSINEPISKTLKSVKRADW